MSYDYHMPYLLLEGLTGVSARRDGGDMIVRVLSGEEARPGLPRGYAHDASLPGAFQVRPNIECDEPLAGRRWRELRLGVDLRADSPWRVRVRMRPAGWSAAKTELWQEIELAPGQAEAVVDTGDLLLCTDGGSLAYIRFDVLAAPAGGELRIHRIAAEEHDGTSFWAPRIDRFGQRRAGDWPGKVRDESELAAEAETAPPAPVAAGERDRWGGWLNGPAFEATGAFRLERDGDRWWLVTPEGHPYLSLGACCTGVGSVGFHTRGRESWFEQPPEKHGELGEAWRPDPRGAFGGAELDPRSWHAPGAHDPDDPGLTVCNYLVANLIRAFGRDWYERWCDRTEARLDGWGLTSLGCWSDARFAENRQRPIVLPAERLCDHDWSELQAPRDPVWPVKAAPDAFDARFEETISGSFEDLKRFRGESWVLGFFVGNEQKWSSLVTPLAMPLHWASRRVFLEELKEKYGSIEALNHAWCTGYASWDTLANEQTNEHPPGFSATGVADCDAFLERYCDRYFGAVRAEIERALPGSLFWGCRYLALPPREAVLRGSARHMDVVSINWYLWHKQEPEDAEAFLGRWHAMTGGRPLAMTEWSFEVTDSRLLAGRALITTEAERAELAQRYIDACFRLPFVVGLHWFQWPDQPIVGRSPREGERAGFGIVDVADRPHGPLVEAFRACSERMYALHNG